jgi:hypothetical protein
MARLFWGLLGSAAAAALVGAPASLVARATQVSYEIQARTVSGLGAPAGGGLSAAALLELMQGGAPASWRSLDLTLRSAGPLPSAATAEHRIPPGLGLGAALPLLPPAAAAEKSGSQPNADTWDASGAKARLLLYRGCTEDGPTAPVQVIELAQLLPDQRAMAMALARLGRLVETANPDRATGAVVGRWPNALPSPLIPASASLVGSHSVRGAAIPKIAFELDPDDDFLEPIALRAALVAGTWQLTWVTQPRVLGYQAMVVGPGSQEGDLVIWSSHAGERWDGTLLAPQRTTCSLSPQATAQLQRAVLQFSALGEPVQRQAAGVAPTWGVRLERQAVLIQPLLEDMPILSPAEGARVGPRKPPLFHRGAFNLIRGIF